LIRFPDLDAKRRALAYLAGRFAFKSWATGEMLVPETALPDLAIEGIPFSVEGPARSGGSKSSCRCGLTMGRRSPAT